MEAPLTVYESGPINIQQGNSATFTVEFISSLSELTVPSSAYVTISYVDLSAASVSETFDLTEDNSFFTGTWSSTSASLGLATWIAYASNSTASQATGQLRIIQRQSTY